MTPVRIAEAILRTIREHISGETATVFVIIDDECAVMDMCDDPYQALNGLPHLARLEDEGRQIDGIGLSSYGWAAPIADDESSTYPSDHPLRRRVHLVTIFMKDGSTASVFTFLDNGETVTDAHGETTGSLADALRMTAAVIFAERGGLNP